MLFQNNIKELLPLALIFSPAIEDPGTLEIDLSVTDGDDDFTQNDLHIFLVLTD